MCDKFWSFLLAVPPIVVLQGVLIIFPFGLFSIAGIVRTKHDVMDYHVSKEWTEVFGNITHMSLCAAPSFSQQTSPLAIEDVLHGDKCIYPLQPKPVPPTTPAGRPGRVAISEDSVDRNGTEDGGNATHIDGIRRLCVGTQLIWHVSSKQACIWVKQASGNVVSVRGLVCGSQLKISDSPTGHVNISADLPKATLSSCCQHSRGDCHLEVNATLSAMIDGVSVPAGKPTPQFCNSGDAPVATEWLPVIRYHGNDRCNSSTAELRPKFKFYTHSLLFQLMLDDHDRVSLSRAVNTLAALTLTFSLVVMVSLVCNSPSKRRVLSTSSSKS